RGVVRPTDARYGSARHPRRVPQPATRVAGEPPASVPAVCDAWRWATRGQRMSDRGPRDDVSMDPARRYRDDRDRARRQRDAGPARVDAEEAAVAAGLVCRRLAGR